MSTTSSGHSFNTTSQSTASTATTTVVVSCSGANASGSHDVNGHTCRDVTPQETAGISQDIANHALRTDNSVKVLQESRSNGGDRNASNSVPELTLTTSDEENHNCKPTARNNTSERCDARDVTTAADVDPPPSYDQLSSLHDAACASAYRSHNRLPVSSKSNSLPVSCSAALLSTAAATAADYHSGFTARDSPLSRVMTSSSGASQSDTESDQPNELESSLQSHSVPNLVESCDTLDETRRFPVIKRLSKRMSESDLRLRHKYDPRLLKAGTSSSLCS